MGDKLCCEGQKKEKYIPPIWNVPCCLKGWHVPNFRQRLEDSGGLSPFCQLPWGWILDRGGWVEIMLKRNVINDESVRNWKCVKWWSWWWKRWWSMPKGGTQELPFFANYQKLLHRVGCRSLLQVTMGGLALTLAITSAKVSTRGKFCLFSWKRHWAPRVLYSRTSTNRYTGCPKNALIECSDDFGGLVSWDPKKWFHDIWTGPELKLH